ncbi:MAG: STAS/SEC14 domain-containing protein [Polyangiaceae bacterium]|nr:STAS/SEC14 domain-containing protein [Polyangiaceae bacterium]
MSGDDGKNILRSGPIRVWHDDAHGIIVADFDPRAELTLEHARASTESMRRLTNNVARPLLVDFTNMKSQTKECRDYFAKDPNHIATYTAAALLVNSPLTRVIANFFIGINKAAKPTRLFDDRKKAIEWLLAQ